MDSYPYTSYDQYRQRSDLLGHLSEALHENCFKICATKAPELPFLSVQEGLCFRNCITKFSVFYPTLKENLVTADFRHYEQELINEGAKKDPMIKKSLIDPWEKERDTLLDEMVQSGKIHQ